MEKIKLLLPLMVVWSVIAFLPDKSNATTVIVESNSSSGIANAKLTSELDDGTILGFYQSSNSAFFCGAVSQNVEIVVPDSIKDKKSSKIYPVTCIGYSKICDFDNAKSTLSIIVPTTVKEIRGLPPTLKTLHLSNYVPTVNSESLHTLERILVPAEMLTEYFENNSWQNYVLINEEGKDPYKITVNVAKPGEFAQMLLLQTDNWYKVNELTVTGELSADDLNVFKRMRQLTSLDLSGATIADIPDKFDGASTHEDKRDGFNLLKKLVLPELNSIGKYAFAQCYNLKDITIPKAEQIKTGAFAQCVATEIILPENLQSVDDCVFYKSGLRHISIPSSVTRIGNSSFSKSCLSSIIIPPSVKEIGNYTFESTALTSIELPGVETIGREAFGDCQLLSDVKLSDGLVAIGLWSFKKCISLTEIDLPSTITDLGQEVLEDCKNVKIVKMRPVVPPDQGMYFILDNCDVTDVKLYVPSMSVDKYRVKDGWKNFYTILPLEERTSNMYIYDDVTIDDGSTLTEDCVLAIDWMDDYCGALDYNGTNTLSMRDFRQYHNMGSSGSNANNYSSGALFTSLISNGPMRADNVSISMSLAKKDTWYFISLPYDVRVKDISYTADTQFAIRKYSGANRALHVGDTWLNLTADSVMHAYEGYIFSCDKNKADFTFPAINNSNKNNIFEKESVVKPLGEYLSEFEHNRSWNLIGNPYPCFYDTRYLNLTSPITIWNRFKEKYDAFSPVDDSFILHPSQSFFIQCPVGHDAVIFDKGGRQKDATVRDFKSGSGSRRTPDRAIRKVYNVLMSDGTDADRSRFVFNENAERGYELDKDASKFFSGEEKSVLVYTIENGVRYAINERPYSDGIVRLGFYVPVDGEYTLAIDSRQDCGAILIDDETKEETVLDSEVRFFARSGFNDSRFTLKFGDTSYVGSIINDVEPTEGKSSYEIYAMDGRFIGRYSAVESADLPKGIYIIRCKDVTRKIIIQK